MHRKGTRPVPHPIAKERDMTTTTSTILAAALTLMPLAASASSTGVVLGEKAVLTATIQSIDAKTRAITLKADDGMTTTVIAGDEVKRFSELKVGDRVTFNYVAATVVALKPSDQPLSAPVQKESTVRNTTGAIAGAQRIETSAVVGVEAIDPKSPSITVKTADGRSLVFLVADKTALEGVKVGDRIAISYTEAVAVKVEPAVTQPAAATAR
jgi:Cu/Ag efflux protein CusF